MSSIFCCPATTPYKNRTLSHEAKFKAFLNWAAYRKESSTVDAEDIPTDVNFAVQVVQQRNYGPLESKRYFVSDGEGVFVEVKEQWLIEANFEKLNTFKNFKCKAHNKFFEVNVYQKDPVNQHHWRANVARPAGDIDL